jgi:hypothetical protein
LLEFSNKNRYILYSYLKKILFLFLIKIGYIFILAFEEFDWFDFKVVKSGIVGIIWIEFKRKNIKDIIYKFIFVLFG